MNTKKTSIVLMFMRLILIFMAVISLLPIMFAFFTSFKSDMEFYKNIWALPETPRIQNYFDAITIGRVGEYAVNSVVIAVISLTVAIVVSVFAAYALARMNLPGAEILLLLMLLIQILPTESLLIPIYKMVSSLGLLKIRYAGIIIPYIAWLLPGNIIILANFFKTIPLELLESARIDGAGELKTMTNIMVPLMKAPISTCLVLDFCFVWGELMWAQIATLTSEKGLPLTIGLLNFKGLYSTDWGLMTAAICIIVIPLYVMFLFTQKYFVAGLTAGGVKG